MTCAAQLMSVAPGTLALHHDVLLLYGWSSGAFTSSSRFRHTSRRTISGSFASSGSRWRAGVTCGFHAGTSSCTRSRLEARHACLPLPTCNKRYVLTLCSRLSSAALCLMPHPPGRAFAQALREGRGRPRAMTGMYGESRSRSATRSAPRPGRDGAADAPQRPTRSASQPGRSRR